MPRPIQAIDHLLTYVHDLDAAASLFRRMGFTLSPVSHIESMGIANHLVLMQPLSAGIANFIELMAAQDRGKLPPAMAELLSGREAIKSMVLATQDAAAAHAAIAHEGFAAAPPVHVRREWVVGAGESVYPEFDVILPFKAPLTFNCCRYFNVDLYLRPEWLKHPNGAQRLRAVLAVAGEPGRLAAMFGRLFEERAIDTTDQASVASGGVELVMLSPATARDRHGVEDAVPAEGARYLGYEIEVASLSVLEACLVAGRLAYRRETDAIVVDPAIALGNLIVFRGRA